MCFHRNLVIIGPPTPQNKIGIKIKKIWQLLTILKKFARNKKSLFRGTTPPKIHQNLTPIQIFLRIKRA